MYNIPLKLLYYKYKLWWYNNVIRGTKKVLNLVVKLTKTKWKRSNKDGKRIEEKTKWISQSVNWKRAKKKRDKFWKNIYINPDM